jgi:hypothetical protein
MQDLRPYHTLKYTTDGRLVQHSPQIEHFSTHPDLSVHRPIEDVKLAVDSSRSSLLNPVQLALVMSSIEDPSVMSSNNPKEGEVFAFDNKNLTGNYLILSARPNKYLGIIAGSLAVGPNTNATLFKKEPADCSKYISSTLSIHDTSIIAMSACFGIGSSDIASGFDIWVSQMTPPAAGTVVLHQYANFGGGTMVLRWDESYSDIHNLPTLGSIRFASNTQMNTWVSKGYVGTHKFFKADVLSFDPTKPETFSSAHVTNIDENSHTPGTCILYAEKSYGGRMVLIDQPYNPDLAKSIAVYDIKNIKHIQPMNATSLSLVSVPLMSNVNSIRLGRATQLTCWSDADYVDRLDKEYTTNLAVVITDTNLHDIQATTGWITNKPIRSAMVFQDNDPSTPLAMGNVIFYEKPDFMGRFVRISFLPFTYEFDCWQSFDLEALAFKARTMSMQVGRDTSCRCSKTNGRSKFGENRMTFAINVADMNEAKQSTHPISDIHSFVNAVCVAEVKQLQPVLHGHIQFFTDWCFGGDGHMFGTVDVKDTKWIGRDVLKSVRIGPHTRLQVWCRQDYHGGYGDIRNISEEVVGIDLERDILPVKDRTLQMPYKYFDSQLVISFRAGTPFALGAFKVDPL